MHGLHLTADLHGCRGERRCLTDAPYLLARCAAIVARAGMQVVGQAFHAFSAPAGAESGLTATLLLAQSHVCVHTWPERDAVTLDVYVCDAAGAALQAEAVMGELLALFAPQHAERHALVRGASSPAPAAAS